MLIYTHTHIYIKEYIKIWFSTCPLNSALQKHRKPSCQKEKKNHSFLWPNTFF